MHAASLDQTSVVCVRDTHEECGVSRNEHGVFTPVPSGVKVVLRGPAWQRVHGMSLCAVVSPPRKFGGALGYVIKK